MSVLVNVRWYGFLMAEYRNRLHHSGIGNECRWQSADVKRSPAWFSSPADKVHLEKKIASSDAVLFGAGTLRAYSTTLGISNPNCCNNDISKITTSTGAWLPDKLTLTRLRFFRQSIWRWFDSGWGKRWKDAQNLSKFLFVKHLTRWN